MREKIVSNSDIISANTAAGIPRVGEKTMLRFLTDILLTDDSLTIRRRWL